ncbi:MAG: DUF6712 family protein [Rikenellaceae bacterium]
MNNLIGAEDVIELAFSPTDQISADTIIKSKITAAEQRYIRPALGDDLYEALMRGEYAELTSEYVAPALAMYVRYLVIPDISVKLNDLGAQAIHGEHLSSATIEERREARMQTRDDADTLLSGMLRHLQANNDAYPEYQEMKRKRTKIIGGIIL